jgi:hypothetical protein
MLVVALVAIVPYLVTIGYGFVYDDGPIIADNSALHTPGGMIDAWRVARIGRRRGGTRDSFAPWCSSSTRCSGMRAAARPGSSTCMP